MTETRNGAANRRCQSIRNVNKISLVGGTHPEVGYFHPQQFLTLFYLRQKSECCCRFLSRVAAGRLVPLARAPSAAQCGVLEPDLERPSCHEQQPTQNGANRSKGGFCVACHGCAVSRLESPSILSSCASRFGPSPPSRPSPLDHTLAHSILCTGC